MYSNRMFIISRMVQFKSSTLFYLEILPNALKQVVRSSSTCWLSYLDTPRPSAVHLNRLLNHLQVSQFKVIRSVLTGHLEILHSAFKQVAHHLQVSQFKVIRSVLPGHLEILHSAFKQVAHHLHIGALQIFHPFSNLGRFSPVDLHLKDPVIKTTSHTLGMQWLLFSSAQLRKSITTMTTTTTRMTQHEKGQWFEPGKGEGRVVKQRESEDSVQTPQPFFSF